MNEPSINNDATCTTKLAVWELVQRYAQAMQRGDWDEYESLFTADATWESPPPLDLCFVGARAIREAVAGMTSSAGFFVQVPLSLVVNVLGQDRATATTAVQEIVRGEDEQAMMLYGMCDDEFTNTGEGWRFSRRRFQPFFMGSTPMSGTLVVDRSKLQ